MANRNLTTVELSELFAPLIDDVRAKMKELSNGDDELYWALRRKLYKELGYDERSKPTYRKILKLKKIAEQGGKCAICLMTLPEKNAVMDRFQAMKGYVSENVRILCPQCDTSEQMKRGYA